MATGRIGPNDPTVWSSNAMVTRSEDFARSRRRGSPSGAASAARTAPSRSGSGGSAAFRLARQPTRVGRQRGPQRSITVGQLDVHAGGSQPRAWNARNHLRNMSSVSMQSWKPACRALMVLTSVVGGVWVRP